MFQREKGVISIISRSECWFASSLMSVFFNLFRCSGTFRKCLCCSWNHMQWSKCLSDLECNDPSVYPTWNAMIQVFILLGT